MTRVNKLTSSGLIVTIIFVVALVGTIVTLVVMACIDKSKAKKDARERAALLGGSKKAMEDLEPAAKPYKIGGGGGDAEELLTKSAPPQQQQVPQIQLHQGIGALGGSDDDNGQHWSNDYAATSGQNRL